MRQRTVKVKVAAEYQPVLPPAQPGSPFVPVEFTGMTVFPYTDTGRCQGKGKCGARQAYSLKATGVRAPSRGSPGRRLTRRTRPDARPPRPRRWPCPSTPGPRSASASTRPGRRC